MPSSNGVYSLPVGYLATTGATILASQHNPPLEDIAAALTLRLSRDGTAPMTGALKLASGTAASPGAAFQVDATTGLFKTTNGVGVAVGGVQVAEFTGGGLASGARFIGELIPFTLSTPPALTVLPFGQTLSRTTYAALWVVAQAEITAGSTLYNNGDGSTTFGIPDLRGRILIPNDKMGGSAASRVTTAGSGINGAVNGSTGGTETQTLTLSQVPTGITVNGTLPVTVGSGLNVPATGGNVSPGTGNGGSGSGPQSSVGSWGNGTFTAAGTLTSNNTSGAAHPNMPPGIIVNYLLFAGV